ncbi:MAG: hypothetical protein HY903_00110 [Deltaproteobacteria bacterium]|nr:hypothetical protein [Deltaproteobacteria bacterium]
MTAPVLLALALGAQAPAVDLDTGSDPEKILIAANNRYDSADFAGAAALYHRLVALGVDNGHVYYNLGNASLRAGQLGHAVAAYLMARGRMPRDSDVRANLEFARRATKDALLPPAPSPVWRTLFFWHYSLSRAELLWLACGANLLLWALLALRLVRRTSDVLGWLVATAAVLFVAVGASTAIRFVSPTTVAVVLAPEVDVHSGTSHDSVVRFKLHAGTEAWVTGREQGWVRLQLPEDKQGWVEDGEVAVASW